jgi:hypothetical protein
MPSIQITTEQADALARGENITLAPTRRRSYVLVSVKGNVWRVSTHKLVPTGIVRAHSLPHFQRAQGDVITLLAERINGSADHRVPKPGLDWKIDADGDVRVTEVKP